MVRFLWRTRETLFGRAVLPTVETFPRRILIIRPFYLGDILLCLPVAQAIKRQCPDARIAWLLREEWAELLNDHCVVDEVIPYSEQRLHSSAALDEIARVTAELRKRSFDLVLNLTWDRSSSWWTWRSGASVRLGIEEFGRPRLSSLLHTATVMAPERSQDRSHMADFYYEPLRQIGFSARTERPKIRATAEEQERVKQRLRSSLSGNSFFVLIHPGARLANKQWPPARFRELIERLIWETVHGVVLVCGPGEESLTAELAKALPQGRGLFWAVPALGELMALAEQAAVFVGNNSGPMHLAAAVGCRVVALFGMDPTRWSPVGEGHQVLGGAQGLTSVSVEDVLRAVGRITRA
jgi:ADP-heptose:LPS heptosyltransferase